MYTSFITVHFYVMICKKEFNAHKFFHHFFDLRRLVQLPLLAVNSIAVDS